MVPQAQAITAPVSFWPVIVQAYSTDPVGVLFSVAACLAAAALSALLVAAIPALFVSFSRCAALYLLGHYLSTAALSPSTSAANQLQTQLAHACIFMQALRRSAHAMEALLHVLREEIPDTAAAVRLSGLEIADAVEEVGALGSDLTEGIRASARMMAGAEQGLRESINFAGQAVTSYVVPSVKEKIPTTKGG